MAKLPGWVFVVVGVGMLLYSRFIESKLDGNGKMILFYVAGVCFVIYGFAKSTFSKLSRAKKHKERVRAPKELPHDHNHKHPAGNQYHGQSNHETHKHVQPHKHSSHPHQASHKTCPRCHSANSLHIKNCHKCGWQFY